MCGRYTLKQLGEDFAEELGIDGVPEELEARFNICPTQDVLVVPNRPKRSFQRFRWGLVPHWAKDISIGAKLVNARAESLGEKPSFRDPFRRRRCAIVADGFYEWKKEGGGKAPYFIQLRGGGTFTFAGLWDRWVPPAGGAPLFSCTIVTVDANELLRPIHDRMPVILGRDAREAWLATDDPGAEALTRLLTPYDPAALEAWPVSRRVNTPANDDASLVAPV